jgi:hypothetical protein
MKRIAIIASLVFLAACTDEQGATRVLMHEGYKDIRITGYRFLGCGNDDDYSTGFAATSPSGAPVTGVVCSGLMFKASTVRLD